MPNWLIATGHICAIIILFIFGLNVLPVETPMFAKMLLILGPLFLLLSHVANISHYSVNWKWANSPGIFIVAIIALVVLVAGVTPHLALAYASLPIVLLSFKLYKLLGG